MKKLSKNVALAGMIGALYALLTLLQNIIFPGSASQAVQFRLSEMLMMLCAISPSAIYGLTLGCAVANIFSAMPIDILLGSLATLLASWSIYLTRRLTWKQFPVLSVIFPSLFNGLIVGAEIAWFSGQFSLLSFLSAAACVALGEISVSTVLGIPFYFFIRKQKFYK